ncbi:hypothetical protein [Streptomyces marincola]|uniref:hypothetical protein n=1 Tax=Streptomyces marincola TaxID=2878388 RepID=UPI00131DD40D|nr:hypothetical protein [Streptomyces marincola]
MSDPATVRRAIANHVVGCSTCRHGRDCRVANHLLSAFKEAARRQEPLRSATDADPPKEN